MAYNTHDIADLQRATAPSVYGRIDLDITPERFRRVVDTPPRGLQRAVDEKKLTRFLSDEEHVELHRQLTLMGDPIADAFAARIPEIGMRRAREMMTRAIEEGVEAVPEAPPELVALIREMETEPEWLDWERVERFHQRFRPFSALSAEYLIRLAFMMTYANGYQGLPMIMTGQLSGPSAAGRMKETSSTFRLATLPGSLRRDGKAWRSAAMVRMMHAMVRTSLLKNPEAWDYEVYGVPIPQVDQMGAALPINFFVALAANRTRRPFTEFERDAIEASRRLASLLGMHDYFLADDRRGILKSWGMLGATLRDKIDERSVELNRATLYAYTRTGDTPLDKLLHELDVRNTRFLYTKVMGSEMAAKLGVRSHPSDPLATVLLVTPLVLAVLGLEGLRRLPGGEERVQAWAVRRIKRQLAQTGEAKYATHEAQYSMGERQAHAPRGRAGLGLRSLQRFLRGRGGNHVPQPL